MVELRALHFSDVHEDYAKLEAIQEFLAGHQNIDVTLYSGDFIQCQQTESGLGTIDRVIKQGFQAVAETEDFQTIDTDLQEMIAELADEEGNVNPDQFTDEQKKGVHAIIDKKNALVMEGAAESALDVFNESYQKLADEFKKISDLAPVYGVLGNHDLTIGYEHLGKGVTFLETTEKEVVKGKSGIEFILKGNINSWEVPQLFQNQFLHPVLKEHMVDYNSGNLATNLDEKIEKARSENRKNDVDRLTHNKSILPQVVEYQEKERERLGVIDEIDIYLAHKLPNNRTGNPNGWEPDTSEITVEYSANASCTYGGHFHGMQVGNKHIGDRLNPPKNFFNDLMKQKGIEITKVDGVDVPVYHLDEDEPWTINPGVDYVTVSEYNKEKEIERVIIYEYIDE
jgi:Icc-related predicted phosphoesterase